MFRRESPDDRHSPSSNRNRSQIRFASSKATGRRETRSAAAHPVLPGWRVVPEWPSPRAAVLGHLERKNYCASQCPSLRFQFLGWHSGLAGCPIDTHRKAKGDPATRSFHRPAPRARKRTWILCPARVPSALCRRIANTHQGPGSSRSQTPYGDDLCEPPTRGE